MRAPILDPAEGSDSGTGSVPGSVIATREEGEMPQTMSLRERQAPLKARYQAEPGSGKLTITVRSVTEGDDPTRCRIATVPFGGGAPATYDVAAHPMAGGDGEPACSGDVLLASLAACQEITLRMVAAAMGIRL